MRILGAAAAGLAVGAFLPQIGAMLVGQQGDRVILQQDERLIVRHDETARFLQEGSDVRVEDFAVGVSLVTVTRPDGSRVLSWRDASGQVVRRVRVLPDGREITLFDGLEAAAGPEIRVTKLPPIRREDQRRAFLSGASADELVRVLSSQPVSEVEDRFTLRQILVNDQIRWLVPSLSLDAVTFDTGTRHSAPRGSRPSTRWAGPCAKWSKPTRRRCSSSKAIPTRSARTSPTWRCRIGGRRPWQLC
jgi:hypothetical protein